MDEVRDLGRPADPIPAAGTKFAFGSAVASAGATPRSSEVDASTLTWTTVTSAEAACALVSSALERRVTADNGLNSVSSRSHLIIFYALLGPRGERKGQLALVDLAGSERLGRTEATGGLRDEAISINRSLTALGDVLHALVGKTEHVPYRHSKLTTLLQPCLKRGARVALIIAASPSSEDALETIQTLGFGVRARNVHLGPMASTSSAAGGAAGGGLQKEVARLQKELVEAKAQAAAHERSLASFKQQASSTDEAAKGKSEAIKRADAKAKEAEHALKRSEAAAHAERSRLLKEMEELQRKLDVATSRARRPERYRRSAQS
jgi:flagellar biosynthesis GTPase FlhF